MNTNAGVTALTYRYHAAAAELEPQINRIVLEMTGRIVRHLESYRGTTAVVLSEAAGLVKRDLLDRILSAEFLSSMFPDLMTLSSDARDEWIRNCSYLIRRLASDLVIPLPSTQPAAPTAIWALGSVTGAACGAILPSLFGIDPQLRLTIATALSPIGALGGVFAVRWMGARLSIVQRLLDIRAQDTLDKNQLTELARDTIHSWISSHIVILLLTGRLISISEGDATRSPEAVPDRLLQAIHKLAEVPSDRRGMVADEVIQEFYNAGYKMGEFGTVTWTDSLRTDYDIVGVVREGDMCRILVCPIVQDGEVRRKGRLTRLR